jgi:hypothetical protein
VAYLPRRLSEATGGFSGREVLGRRPVPAQVKRAVDRGVAVEHGLGIVRAAQARHGQWNTSPAKPCTLWAGWRARRPFMSATCRMRRPVCRL